MIRLTWGNLRDQRFMEPLGRIFETKGVGWELKHKLMVLGELIQGQQKLLDKSYQELLLQFCTVDPSDKNMRKIKEETKAEFDKALEAFHATEFECKITKFDPLKLDEKVGLSAADLMSLKPILHPFELPGETTPLKAVPKEQPATAPTPAH